MIGAILGDIAGEPYEFNNHRSWDAPLFQPPVKYTDDSLLTLATADALLGDRDFANRYRTLSRNEP